MSVELMLAGAGAGMVNNGMQAMFQDRADSNWRENQAFAQKLAQDAQRDSMANLIEGAKKAGISPAVVANGNFSPAVAGSAPMQQRNAVPLDMASMFQAQKAGEVADAQVENLKEEARMKRIENDRKDSEDLVLDSGAQKYLEQIRDSYPKDSYTYQVYDEVAKTPKLFFTRGAYDALKDVADFDALLSEIDTRKSTARLQNLINNAKVDSKAYRALASMPEAELQLVYKDVVLKQALAVNAYEQSKTEGDKRAELQKRQAYLESEAKKVDEEARRIRYGKYGNMWERGDLTEAVAEIAGNTAEVLGEEVAHEGAKLGADVIRAKTGTPHGLIRSESKRSAERRESGSEEWKDRRGVTHRRSYEDAFPLPDNY